MKRPLSPLFALTIAVCILTDSTAAWSRSARHWPNVQMWLALATVEARTASGLASGETETDPMEAVVPSADTPAATATATPTTLGKRTTPVDALDEERIMRWLVIWTELEKNGGSSESSFDVQLPNEHDDWIVRCVVSAMAIETMLQDPLPSRNDEESASILVIASLVLQDPSSAHPNATIHSRIVGQLGSGHVPFPWPMRSPVRDTLPPHQKMLFHHIIEILHPQNTRGR